MARINRIKKSRKEQKCSKCGKILPIGSEYLKATPYHARPIIRCTSCGLRSWETSQSEFIQTCGSISEDWRTNYGVEGVSDIVSELENLRDTTQDSYDNMPESLQYGPTGEELENRVSMLDDVISNLENIEDFEDYLNNARDEYLSDHGMDEDDELSEEAEAEIRESAENAIDSDIEDALSGLEY